MNEKLDLGMLIKKKLNEQVRSVSWLAKQIPYDRSNLHKILQRYDIPPSLLLRISRILGHDFFKDCSAFLHESDTAV